MIPGDVRLCLRCQSRGVTACPPIPAKELQIIIENGYVDKHLISEHIVDIACIERPASDTDKIGSPTPNAYPARFMSVRIVLHYMLCFY